ncbi:Serine/threonine-protein phosphatase 7 long form [Glycine max]|nr:Serine/threonine-protein phosphatase 7 long form [Glycine max]
MTSSSSCSSNIQIKSYPIDEDVVWMQAKHVLEHVWNEEADRKLHIRRVVPIYQGQAEIPEEIIPLLRPETHTFHMRCRECTITLQNVSADLCEELLGVRPQEGKLQGNVVKLSWLAHHFSQINNHDGNVEQLQRFTHAWILRFIGGVLFVDKSSNKVSLRYLQILRDFGQCSTYAWGSTREICSAIDYKIKSIRGMCILIQMWALERCTTLAPKRTSPVTATWKSTYSQ